jgi:hypothetical protein
MFITSCAHGAINNLAMKHLNMENLKDQIDRKELSYRKPIWLKTMEDKQNPRDNRNNKRPLNGQGGGGNYNGVGPVGGHNNQGPNKSARGEVVHNPNPEQCLKIQSGERYSNLFHPRNQNNLQKPQHSDGSEWCNNWHF